MGARPQLRDSDVTHICLSMFCFFIRGSLLILMSVGCPEPFEHPPPPLLNPLQATNSMKWWFCQSCLTWLPSITISSWPRKNEWCHCLCLNLVVDKSMNYLLKLNVLNCYIRSYLWVIHVDRFYHTIDRNQCCHSWVFPPILQTDTFKTVLLTLIEGCLGKHLERENPGNNNAASNFLWTVHVITRRLCCWNISRDFSGVCNIRRLTWKRLNMHTRPSTGRSWSRRSRASVAETTKRCS